MQRDPQREEEGSEGEREDERRGGREEPPRGQRSAQGAGAGCELREVEGEYHQQAGETARRRQRERGRGGALVSEEGDVDVGGAGHVPGEAVRFHRVWRAGWCARGSVPSRR